MYVASLCLLGLTMWCALQGFGVYRYADKYGANVDGYSPIYTPDSWSETGAEYKLGTKGLIAWCAPAKRRVDER